LPGPDAVNLVEAKLSSGDWPNETVVIAGVDGLPKADYADLCQNLDVTIAPLNTPNHVENNQWVNCCLVWVKDRHGNLNRWIQPKIRPAWQEMALRYSDMFQGSAVYVFECQYTPTSYPCRFLSLLCYDWVGRISDRTVCDEVLEKLNTQWLGNPNPLHWIFVIQYNPKPNHPSFLINTYNFLTDRTNFQFVERDSAAVIHVNTAVSKHPARMGRHAFSACVFSPDTNFDCDCCRPTICMQPASLRGESILSHCKDIVFREMGECIHSFEIRVPRFVIPDATDRGYPMINASVHGTGAFNDPRLPGAAVPASVKWLNDKLDITEKVSEIDLLGCQLNTRAEEVEPDIIKALRYLDAKIIEDKMKFAVSAYSGGIKTQSENIRNNPDAWEEIETESLKHVFHDQRQLLFSLNDN